MTTPFYVGPEQLMKDRADYARKGIARGRSVVVLSYADGVLFATHNPSRALHKISEIYDRIGFAAVGKYHEFESLRVAGIRYADLRGFTYDRSDVTVHALANSYAQTLGSVFTSETKPLEVELVVAQVGAGVSQDEIYRLSFDGALGEEPGYVAIGGEAELPTAVLAEQWHGGLDLAGALGLALSALQRREGEPDAVIPVGELEAAVLARHTGRRAFRRLTAADLGAVDLGALGLGGAS